MFPPPPRCLKEGQDASRFKPMPNAAHSNRKRRGGNRHGDKGKMKNSTMKVWLMKSVVF